MNQKKALVVEGGAMRGIFASGVLDAFMEDDFNPYDMAVGVSAGASNLLGYLAHQPKRSYRVITQLATDKRFFNPARFLRGGNLLDVKWLVEESMRLYPLDSTKLFGKTKFIAAATNIQTGQADYYHVNPDNISDVIEATSALPLAYKATPCFSGGCYTDGGVADSIPVREAYRRGARDITVILSHPLSYQMKPTRHPWILQKLFARQPQIAEAMLKRAENYNASLAFIRNPPEDATIRVIAPSENFSVKRLSMRKSTLDEGYQMGLTEGMLHIHRRLSLNGSHDKECHFCVSQR
ncbi:patatin family protein [Photobacterium sp. 1_MG-2023]|uniref:patatin-like phospholipase family protein n=1 Tax=Photobacterium sp. 1_MG-2023 TaxID=3062646 RepID=UPI0026E30C05|nr:patatin family protein [Photobacterium sp. 1_MG-2023]MDO6708637.1 patatin family protein [Photobacterium sp. 1_MG-2023]